MKGILMKHFSVLFLACVLVSMAAHTQQKDYVRESKSQYEARMKWWTEIGRAHV
jgi:hypothetical protein